MKLKVDTNHPLVPLVALFLTGTVLIILKLIGVAGDVPWLTILIPMYIPIGMVVMVIVGLPVVGLFYISAFLISVVGRFFERKIKCLRQSP